MWNFIRYVLIFSYLFIYTSQIAWAIDGGRNGVQSPIVRAPQKIAANGNITKRTLIQVLTELRSKYKLHYIVIDPPCQALSITSTSKHDIHTILKCIENTFGMCVTQVGDLVLITPPNACPTNIDQWQLPDPIAASLKAAEQKTEKTVVAQACKALIDTWQGMPASKSTAPSKGCWLFPFKIPRNSIPPAITEWVQMRPIFMLCNLLSGYKVTEGIDEYIVRDRQGNLALRILAKDGRTVQYTLGPMECEDQKAPYLYRDLWIHYWQGLLLAPMYAPNMNKNLVLQLDGPLTDIMKKLAQFNGSAIPASIAHHKAAVAIGPLPLGAMMDALSAATGLLWLQNKLTGAPVWVTEQNIETSICQQLLPCDRLIWLRAGRMATSPLTNLITQNITVAQRIKLNTGELVSLRELPSDARAWLSFQRHNGWVYALRGATCDVDETQHLNWPTLEGLFCYQPGDNLAARIRVRPGWNRVILLKGNPRQATFLPRIGSASDRNTGYDTCYMNGQRPWFRGPGVPNQHRATIAVVGKWPARYSDQAVQLGPGGK